jgi:hypothetical protein
MGLAYSIKEARRNKLVEVAFSVSQLFISSHNSSEVQVVPDNNFEQQISQILLNLTILCIQSIM